MLVNSDREQAEQIIKLLRKADRQARILRFRAWLESLWRNNVPPEPLAKRACLTMALRKRSKEM